MPSAKLSALSSASALSGSELAYVVQGGAGVKTTAAAIAAVGRLKSNFTATTNPGVSEDSASGYAAGSFWLNTSTGDIYRCLSASSGAAAWVQLGVSDHPGYLSGLWYRADRHDHAAGLMAADTLYAHLVFFPHRVTVSDLGIRVSSGSSSTHAKVGIYSCVAARPGAKLAELASPLDTGTTAYVSGALSSNITLEAGAYFFAALFDGAPSCERATSFKAAGCPQMFAGASSLNNLMAGSVTYFQGTGATYTGGLPSSFGTASIATGNGCPIIGFKVA